MKKNIIIVIIVILCQILFAGVKAYAQNSSTSSADQATQQAIEKLKTKIATQVESMKLEEKRGIIGIVSSTSDNALTVTDINNNTRFIDVDEITKFSNPTNSSFGFSDLTKGTRISIVGLYNKETKRILARFITVTSDPLFLTGAISTLDHINYQLILVMEDNKKQNVDIENSTKISVYTKAGGILHYGFSKLNTSDRLLIVGFPSTTDKTLFEAGRIIDFPDLPKDPAVVLEQPTTATSITPKPSTTIPSQ